MIDKYEIIGAKKYKYSCNCKTEHNYNCMTDEMLDAMTDVLEKTIPQLRDYKKATKVK